MIRFGCILLSVVVMLACDPAGIKPELTEVPIDTVDPLVDETYEQVQAYVGILRTMQPNVTDSVAYAIATAIYVDSKLTGLPPTFYLGLIRVENAYLDHEIENWYGAVGLTQIVERYWDNEFPECGLDLRTDIYTQVCYGARVYLTYLDIWEDETLALYAYNGCTTAHRIRAASCIRFPDRVLGYSKEYETELGI